MFEICQISKKQALPIILERKPLGLFFCEENHRFVAIDNSHGEAFAEEFDTAELCKDWLNGMFEVCDDDTCPDFTEWLYWLSQIPVKGLASRCAVAIEDMALYYLCPSAVQQIESAVVDMNCESPYALADCIFQAAIDSGKSVFEASCLVMDIINDVMKMKDSREVVV